MNNGYACLNMSTLEAFTHSVFPRSRTEVLNALAAIPKLEGRVDMLSLARYRDASHCLVLAAHECGFHPLADTFYSWYVHAVRVLLAS